MIPFKILDSNGSISQRIKSSIAKQVDNNVLVNKHQKLSRVIYDFLYNKFLTSEVYASLAGGILRAEFGLDDFAVSNLSDVIEEIVDVNIYTIVQSNSIKILITFIKDEIDFNELGTYSYQSKKFGIVKIPWLYWLLTQGENTVVSDYSIFLKPGRGRSEMAIMIKEDSGSYSVDGQFSGVENDNWITRIIRNNSKELMTIIKDVMNNAP